MRPQQCQAAFALNQVDREQPRLTDHLPLLPYDLSVDLGGIVAGSAASAGQRDQRSDVFADAGIPRHSGADAGDQRQRCPGYLRIGQQAGLQHLRLRHAVLCSSGTKIGIVLHCQQRDPGNGERRRDVHLVVMQCGQAVGQFRACAQRQVTSRGTGG